MVQSVVRERSFNSVRIFWIDRDLVMERLQRRIDLLSENPHVQKIVLFGSFAEGREVPGSDLDILIVLDEDEREITERIPGFLEVLGDIGISVDIFAYTEDELQNPVAMAALRSGITLFER